MHYLHTYFILSTSSVGEVLGGTFTGFNRLSLIEQGPTIKMLHSNNCMTINHLIQIIHHIL